MKRSISVLAALISVVGASSAMGAGETISAYGTGQIPVTPTDRTKNAPIVAAISDAQTKAYPAAIADARINAQVIATAGNFTLGAIHSVAQQPGIPYYGGGFGIPGGYVIVGTGPPIGPVNGRFCGYVKKAITKKVKVRGVTRFKVIRRYKEWTCYVPSSVVATVEVTFTATPKV